MNPKIPASARAAWSLTQHETIPSDTSCTREACHREMMQMMAATGACPLKGLDITPQPAARTSQRGEELGHADAVELLRAAHQYAVLSHDHHLLGGQEQRPARGGVVLRPEEQLG